MAQLWCAVWGHEVDNHRFGNETEVQRRCRCGKPYLYRDGSLTHVRHTLSCFFGHHTYRKLTDRDGHREYVCVQCGHPLLFEATSDPYDRRPLFKKKVRYLCGLFGHDVHVVGDRDGYREFACHCGHTFLKPQQALTHITHPAICVLSGHRITYLASRAGFLEYVCRDCGHPFCFAEAGRAGSRDSRGLASY
jgi:DNA-directed RNA polymerase subunit RPC12/RpoP